MLEDGRCTWSLLLPPGATPDAYFLSSPDGNVVTKRAIARKQLMPVFAVNTLMFGFGMVLGYSAPALPALRALGVLPDKAAAGWFASIAALGCAVGSVISGAYLLDKFGRKWTIILASVPGCLGSLMICVASGPHMRAILYTGRFIGGIAGGFALVSIHVYVSELSLPCIRGLLSAFSMLAVSMGILIVYSLGLLLPWRWLSFATAVAFLVTAVVCTYIPESPKYAQFKSEREARDKALSPSASWTERLLHASGLAGVRTFMKGTKCQRAIFLSMSLICLQQLQGINVITFYSVDLLLAAEMRESGLVWATVVAAARLVASLLACLCVDRYGRRTLLLVCAMVSLVCCVTIGSIYYYFSHKQLHSTYHQSVFERNLKIVLLLVLLLYIVNYSVGWGPVPRLLAAEIFPLRVRAVMNGMSNCFNWITAFVVTKAYWYLRENMVQNHEIFYVFGIASLLSSLIVFFFQPETKGMSLEQIEHLFACQRGSVGDVFDKQLRKVFSRNSLSKRKSSSLAK